jgi:streptomycin 6-kinase
LHLPFRDVFANHSHRERGHYNHRDEVDKQNFHRLSGDVHQCNLQKDGAASFDVIVLRGWLAIDVKRHGQDVYNRDSQEEH